MSFSVSVLVIYYFSKRKGSTCESDCARRSNVRWQGAGTCCLRLSRAEPLSLRRGRLRAEQKSIATKQRGGCCETCNSLAAAACASSFILSCSAAAAYNLLSHSNLSRFWMRNSASFSLRSASAWLAEDCKRVSGSCSASSSPDKAALCDMTTSKLLCSSG